MDKWRICHTTEDGRLRPIEDSQNAEGFTGPGRALKWLMCAHGLEAQDKLGTELFIVRDDGTRPRVNTRREYGINLHPEGARAT